MAKLNIQMGDQVFLHDGEVAFGTVQRHPPNDAKEIVIYVENAGEFLVPVSAVKAAHDGKVLLDKGKLHQELLEAISHAHDREDASVSEREDDETLEDKDEEI
jgi:hypothetical protein